MTKIVDYKGVEIHRQELVVLKNVNFSIEKGEYVYLVGRVGSGKSSLMKTMYAEIPIPEGEAMVLDYDLMKIKHRDIPMLRRKVGIVFQDFQLLTDRSVYDNLKFVLEATGWKNKNDINDRIDETLKSVGMCNKSYKMPHELSGGEQQRIVIARALLNQPELILADEPTGNLDPETSRQIVSLLYEISTNGTAVIMATHNMQLIEGFPGKVFRCENKQLIDTSNTQEQIVR